MKIDFRSVGATLVVALTASPFSYANVAYRPDTVIPAQTGTQTPVHSSV